MPRWSPPSSSAPAAHFAVGASKALVTSRPWWATGIEMTVVGIIEAAVTYGVGVAFARI
jgi:VIT1/CCC1 family predicted Fe2+/Mn2+ transporter